jgi:hypothetical protein
MNLLRVLNEVDDVLEQRVLHPELLPLYRKLEEVNHELNEIILAIRSNSGHRVDIGDETTEICEILQEDLSSHSRMRKAQSKKLARKLYSIYHSDLENSGQLPWITFSQIRQLAKRGEIELLWYIRSNHGLEETDDVKLQTAISFLDARLSRLQSSPGFQLVRLNFSNKEAFLDRMRTVIAQKTQQLEIKLLATRAHLIEGLSK